MPVRPYVSFMGAQALAMNPIDALGETELAGMLMGMCSTGLNEPETAEVGEQVDAVVRAAIELRDVWGERLSVAWMVSMGTAEGFNQLANDMRLSLLSRNRCAAIYTRTMTSSKRSVRLH